MKKIKIFYPIITLATLVPTIGMSSCANNKSVIDFSIEQSGIGIYDSVHATIKLDWQPTDHSIEFSNFNFTYNGTEKTKWIEQIDPTARPLSLKLAFNEPIIENDITDGILTFHYNDKTLNKEGDKSFENIQITKFKPEIDTQFNHSCDETKHEAVINNYLLNQDPNMVVPNYILPGPGKVLCKVIKINENAFKDRQDIETAIIPDGVKTIESGCFENCSVTSVKFNQASELTSIPQRAFNNCSSLQIINIPNKVKSIGNNAFTGCKKIKRIDLPGTLTTIGNEAFRDCAALQTITFNGTVDQFEAIGKGTDWASEIPTNCVQCTDGQYKWI